MTFGGTASATQKGSLLRPVEGRDFSEDEDDGKRLRKASKDCRDENAGGRNHVGTVGRSSVDSAEVEATIKDDSDLSTEAFDWRRVSVKQMVKSSERVAYRGR